MAVSRPKKFESAKREGGLRSNTMSSSLLFSLLTVVQAFAPSVQVAHIAPHGRDCPAQSRLPPRMVATTLPGLARLAEQCSPAAVVAKPAGKADFLSAFRQAASDRHGAALPNLARLAEKSTPEIVAEKSSLEIVTDANFESAVLASPQPVLLEFYAEYCGPCRQCEPALKQMDAAFPELKVVKTRLNHNPALEDWLLANGLKVSKLPTLLLVKDGKPLRALTGKAARSIALLGRVPDVALPSSGPRQAT